MSVSLFDKFGKMSVPTEAADFIYSVEDLSEPQLSLIIAVMLVRITDEQANFLFQHFLAFHDGLITTDGVIPS